MRGESFLTTQVTAVFIYLVPFLLMLEGTRGEFFTIYQDRKSGTES
jgi:hypothetical protein